MRVGSEIVETELREDEQDEMLRRAQGGDARARNEYLIMNIGLVYLAAFNYKRLFPWADLPNLLQEALIAMDKCITKYKFGEDLSELLSRNQKENDGEDKNDIPEEVSLPNNMITNDLTEEDPTTRAKFSTYALASMRPRLLHFLRRQNPMEIPLLHEKELMKAGKIINKFEGTARIMPRKTVVEEVSKQLRIPEHKAEQLVKAWAVTNSENNTDFTSVANNLIDQSPTPEEILHEKELRAAFRKALSLLTPRDRKILEIRYGIDQRERGGGRTSDEAFEYSHDEIGEMFDVSGPRISQIENRAVRNLKYPSLRDILSAVVEEPDFKYLLVPREETRRILSRLGSLTAVKSGINMLLTNNQRRLTELHDNKTEHAITYKEKIVNCIRSIYEEGIGKLFELKKVWEMMPEISEEADEVKKQRILEITNALHVYHYQLAVFEKNSVIRQNRE